MTLDPPRCVLPAGVVVVGPDVARVLVDLLTPGLDRARYDGWVLPAPVVDVVAGLRRIERGAQAPEPVAVASSRWISTVVAAALLGVSDRQVRNLLPRLQHRRRGGRWELLESDVIDEARAKSEVIGTGRNPLSA